MAAVGQTPVSVQQVIPEWRQKSDYISSLAQTSLFIGLEKEAAKAILDIISTTKN